VKKLKLSLFAGCAALGLVTSAVAVAAPNQDKKEFVCHFTASPKNPVVLINVGNSAVGKHESNHHPEVHQGADSSSNEPLTDCTDGGGESEG
jgi:hypothetical protein